MLDLADDILEGTLDTNLRGCFRECIRSFRNAMPNLDIVLVVMERRSLKRAVIANNLKVACGVPGVLGCASVGGDTVVWTPLLHRTHGLRAAFDILGIFHLPDFLPKSRCQVDVVGMLSVAVGPVIRVLPLFGIIA